MKNQVSIFLILFLTLSAISYGQRIKDIAYFKGESNEQLIGYGLVIGLAGTGDSHRSSFTVQSVISMLKRFGITVPDANLRTRNIAAVMVTATIANQMKQGGQFDVNVSSMGDATSLLGGQLLMTPLSSGISGKLYAFAQGAVSVGGYDISTKTGGRVIKNHALNGRIPLGAMLQEDFIPINSGNRNNLSVVLRVPDYTTANNIANAVNTKYGAGTATAVDGAEITVTVPAANQANTTAFLAELESIEIETDDPAKVVINERTGTIVSGSKVKILPVTISHGNLRITIRSNPLVSQPNPFSQGQTVLYNNLTPTTENESDANVVTIDGANNIQEVASALTSLKVSPRDIIAIFQAIKEAGALPAELVIM